MTGTTAQEIRETPGPARQAPGTALPGEFVLRDGTPALIWPLLPTDAETLRDIFRRLSSSHAATGSSRCSISSMTR